MQDTLSFVFRENENDMIRYLQGGKNEESEPLAESSLEAWKYFSYYSHGFRYSLPSMK